MRPLPELLLLLSKLLHVLLARHGRGVATAATGAAAITWPDVRQGWGLRAGELVLGASIGGWRCCWRSTCSCSCMQGDHQ